VIIQNHQRQTLFPRLRHAFEIHLPELVGRLSFESAHRGPVTIPLADQTVSQQNPMHRDARYPDLLPLQQPHQFGCPPIRVALPACDHALFNLYGRLSRAMLRTPAALYHIPQLPTLPKPLQP
jgi:hypothetical protein